MSCKPAGSRLVTTLSIALWGSFANDCRSLLQPVEDTLSTALTNVLCATRTLVYHTYYVFIAEIQNIDNKSKQSGLFCATLYLCTCRLCIKLLKMAHCEDVYGWKSQNNLRTRKNEAKQLTMHVSLGDGGVTQSRLSDWLPWDRWCPAARHWLSGCDVTRTCRNTFCRLTATVHTTDR